mmetsp:Transcript_29709/g.63148  ORF Transcript_29709/g.63148 Transcript_29709/m.63148 type:complete len:235 (+) Transcript_29709:68-772(+)
MFNSCLLNLITFFAVAIVAATVAAVAAAAALAVAVTGTFAMFGSLLDRGVTADLAPNSPLLDVLTITDIVVVQLFHGYGSLCGFLQFDIRGSLRCIHHLYVCYSTIHGEELLDLHIDLLDTPVGREAPHGERHIGTSSLLQSTQLVTSLEACCAGFHWHFHECLNRGRSRLLPGSRIVTSDLTLGLRCLILRRLRLRLLLLPSDDVGRGRHWDGGCGCRRLLLCLLLLLLLLLL